MKFSSLLKAHNISKVSANSKEIRPGYAFVAVKGVKYDGNDFIDDAIKNGADLIFTEISEVAIKYNGVIPIIQVSNARIALGSIAAELEVNIPANLMAVTGTNGKSSMVHYIGQLLSGLGHRAATIGTLGVNLYKEDAQIELLKKTGLTTSGAVEFNAELAQIKDAEAEFCAVEASSIGLEQYRLYGRKFSVAAFSSFSRDHLDYHGNMEAYFDAKMLLFTDEYMIDKSAVIINSAITEYPKIIKKLNEIGRKYISVGDVGDFSIKIINSSISGTEFIIILGGVSYKVKTNILGSFQITNIVMAIAMLNSLGFKIDDLISYIHLLTAPAGRLERVSESGIGASIFVDYAHTPDALENVLASLNNFASMQKGKLFVVFGCGGERDKGKRKLMGEVAAKYADIIIITDDNPRGEDASTIRLEVLSASKGAIEIGGRREAIKFAVNNMQTADILLIAGKGHEDYQIIGNKSFYFSDKAVAKEICDAKS